MLGYSPSLAYIHEPFNLYHRPGICKAKFSQWFPYVCEENESLCINEINRCLQFKYNLVAEIKALRSFEDMAKMGYDFSRFMYYRLLSTKRPLVKDPIALFSLEWLVERFKMDAVILIRHPAAFAGSLKKIQWTHPFAHFLAQPLLMERYLEPFREQLEEFAAEEKDIVDQSILLWNMIHQVILQYQKDHPDWIFVKHEDISKDPVRSFAEIYERLGIAFTEKVRKKIEEHSNLNRPGKVASKLVRDSKANIRSWQKRLTKEEIDRVRKGTAHIASEFYDESTWDS